jgi:S1-C subfamily serine protease
MDSGETHRARNVMGLRFPLPSAALFAVLVVVCLVDHCRAEFRTWTAAAGGFTAEAEFVELRDGTTVRLRMKEGGGERDIPLDKLGAADQTYVREQLAKRAGKSAALAALEEAASKCRSAEEELRLYRVFHDDPKTSDADCRAVLPRLDELKELAAKKMLKVAGKWLTPDEVKKNRLEANGLLQQGLELLRLGQEDASRKKFAAASALEPDSVRAEFLLGMIYCLKNRDLAKAKQYFESCLTREPQNVAVLNNLAVVELKRNEYAPALVHWRAAIAAGSSQAVVQNLGRAAFLVQKGRLVMAKSLIADYSDAYVSQLGKNKFGPVSEELGWLYILLDKELLNLDTEEKEQAKALDIIPPPDDEGLEVVGSGTGFVVYPNYVVTNAHVVNAGTAYEIQAPDGPKGKTLKAKLIAKSEKPDLAVLLCEDLHAGSLPIDPNIAGRGTDIMIFGYPHTGMLGATLKATRGVISALPDPALDEMYLYDAVVNPGNSGGPVCDQKGNVVAVETIGVMTEGKYGGGIPSRDLLKFLKKNISNFVEAPLGTKAMDWPEVDQRVGPSTVLIWARKKVGVGEKPADAGGVNYIEDASCTACSRLKTPNAKCPVCNGTGVDQELLARKVAIGKIAGIGTGTPSPATPGRTPPPPRRPGDAPAGPIKDDTGQRFPQAALAGEMAAFVRGGVQGKKTSDTELEGRGEIPFREVPPGGAMLIGFEFGFGRFVSKLTINGIRPIYLSSQGKTAGNWYGPQSLVPVAHIEARTGYAVGGVKIKSGLSIDSISVVFMKVRGTELDPTDTYESPAYGDGDLARTGMLGGNGSILVGIQGRMSRRDGDVDSLGLIMLPK